jgi:hypothetical protein
VSKQTRTETDEIVKPIKNTENERTQFVRNFVLNRSSMSNQAITPAIMSQIMSEASHAWELYKSQE